MFADGGDLQEGVDYTWTDDNTRGGVLTIISEKPMVIANVDGAEITKDHIVIDPGSEGSISVTLDGIAIEYSGDCGIEIALGDRTILLAGGSENKVSCGGAWNNKGCDVIISGGTVVAVGGGSAAGIGDGCYRGSNGRVDGNSGGSITISGGYVSASNGDGSASIGASSGASQDTDALIAISGGAFASGSTVGSGNVYGIALANGYVVKSNNDEDEDLVSSYPYRVYLTQNATLIFADSFEGGNTMHCRSTPKGFSFPRRGGFVMLPVVFLSRIALREVKEHGQAVFPRMLARIR